MSAGALPQTRLGELTALLQTLAGLMGPTAKGRKGNGTEWRGRTGNGKGRERRGRKNDGRRRGKESGQRGRQVRGRKGEEKKEKGGKAGDTPYFTWIDTYALHSQYDCSGAGTI